MCSDHYTNERLFVKHQSRSKRGGGDYEEDSVGLLLYGVRTYVC